MMPQPFRLTSLVATVAATALAIPVPVQADPQRMTIEASPFGTTPEGHPITKTTLTNRLGNRVSLIDWGASLVDVIVPDRQGVRANVNLAFGSLDGYLRKHPYFGSTVGRFCNRIGNARFNIDGTDYEVTRNHGEHHLHGGERNFSRQPWESEPFEEDDAVGVRFSLTSPDGDEGFPGNLRVTVEYRWNDANELAIDYRATTDAPTHVNLTNHSYWNLAGAGSGTALDHVATIHADHFLDVDDDLIPTGKLAPVDGIPLDLRTPTPLRPGVEQLSATRGYDHCYVVRGEAGKLRPAARVVDPKSGRVLEIETTQPGMQLYTANHLPGNENSAGHGGHEAFCLETQQFPNTPNLPEFSGTLLRPGQTLHETTVHRFAVEP